MPAPSSIRQATKDETRDALITAGALEFGEKGIDAPSLDAICARAGFTRGAFYVHFKDKDELLVAVVDRVLRSVQDAIIPSDDAPMDLEETVARYLSAVAAQSPGIGGTAAWRFRHTLDACARLPRLRERYLALQQQAMDRVARAARAGQRAGRVRSDVPAEALAEILIVLTLGISAAFDVALPFDLMRGGAGLATLITGPSPSATKHQLSREGRRKRRGRAKSRRP
jgi:TetR/AcrR family transcriptional regulator, transcriptional repressor for nem operon